ncbi:unnamed protein product [Lepeophtheirus salmonis]|uniref:(salmon louse) hypothetical protein n=1 Tax=Lepeophtheirus salmonis TaxID=72036 RepID=A0A7R8H233_LEPSM|nr:unnamed protein product [Lepeophtheirus salmonis]CAF2820379.1 unnamed protein product [Lepeophtheirus salmonis]
MEQLMKFYAEFDTDGDQDLYSKQLWEILELQKRHGKTVKASPNFARELKIDNLKTEIKYQKELIDIKKGFSSPIEETKIENNEPLPCSVYPNLKYVVQRGTEWMETFIANVDNNKINTVTKFTFLRSELQCTALKNLASSYDQGKLGRGYQDINR